MNTEHKTNTDPEIRDLWQTPKEVFEYLNKDFNFSCDVAASAENALCDNYISADDNALSLDKDWSRVNWCNPPFSNIDPWVSKAIEQRKKGNTTVMLLPSDTSVKWFKKAFNSASSVVFITGRLAFINADTKRKVNGNNKGSVIFMWLANDAFIDKSVRLIDRSEFGL